MVNGVNSASAASSGSAANQPPADLKAKLIALGIPASTIAQGREAVMAYAQANNIQMPGGPPPNQMQNQASGNVFGSASSSSSAGTNAAPGNGEPPADFKAKLEALGIPSSVISQGRDAVMTYAQQNNITMPTPPSPPSGTTSTTGQTLNVTT